MCCLLLCQGADPVRLRFQPHPAAADPWLDAHATCEQAAAEKPRDFGEPIAVQIGDLQGYIWNHYQDFDLGISASGRKTHTVGWQCKG